MSTFDTGAELDWPMLGIGLAFGLAASALAAAAAFEIRRRRTLIHR
jgi:hypothetical protein